MIQPTTYYFMPLSQLGILQVEGDDAQSFLQNLLTNDVTALDINQSQLSGFCNAKGRLFALFLLVRRQQAYQLILPKLMCADLQQRLSMYVLRSKVTISDQTDNLVCIGLTGNNEQTDPPIIQLPNNADRYLCICTPDQADKIYHSLLEQQWQSTSETHWDLLDIADGLPMIFPESKEKFTPQQVNLDLVDGVSFKKGCYPGQEVVARLYYLGKPSRRMFLAEAQTNNLPNIAQEVTIENGDIAGHVVRVQRKDENTLQLLLSLKLLDPQPAIFLDKTTVVTVITTEN